MFTPAIFDAARSIEPSWRDELEITDAIQTLVDRGLRVEPHIVRGWWKDMGQLEDLLEANRLILEDIVARVEGEVRRLAGRGPRRRRGGRGARALHRARARRSSARAAASSTPTSAPTRRSTRT